MIALQFGALREALEDAGASREKSAKAAEELAGYDARLGGIETRLAVLTWMAGAGMALTLLLLGSTIALWTKLGEISGRLMSP